MTLAEFQATHPDYTYIEIFAMPDHVHVSARNDDYIVWSTKVRYTEGAVHAALADALDILHPQIVAWDALAPIDPPVHA